MAKVYFDVTDVVEYAKKNNTVIGIPRVQLNIISLLARAHGGAVIRCIFFDTKRRATFEFDPSLRDVHDNFDGERLLFDLGLLSPSRIFPSSVEVKSYLKRYSGNNFERSLRKAGIYIAALCMRQYLRRKGLKLGTRYRASPLPIERIAQLPPEAIYVCLGAVWWFPHIWEFAAAHKRRGGTVVQMVYDLIPLIYPEYYTPREPPAFIAWLNSSLEYATRFICISEWTAKDLIKYARERGKSPPIEAIPLAHEFVGFDRLSRVPVPQPLADLAERKFVLCVGTIEFRKNNLAMLKIWRELLDELGVELPLLVFAGKYGKGSAEFQEALAQDAELGARVRVAHAPSDGDLAWLYQNCLFTAFPSQFEGWGLPVGEAAWFGKFCVASKVTSIPEVCGDLLDYVDPADMGSIKAAVKKLLVDRDYLRQREQRIVDAKLRTWADVAAGIHRFVRDA